MSCVAIIGAGQMGLHMAATFAHHGYTVRIFDVYRDVLDSVHQRQTELLQELVEEGVLLEPFSPGLILCMSILEEAVSSAEFIFECVSEDITVKYDIVQEVSRYARPNAIIASSTMRIPLEQFMRAVSNPQRSLGVRFLMPVFYINLVEITALNDSLVGCTSLNTINRVRAFLSSMGMTAYLRQNLEPHVLNEAAREQFKQIYIQRQHEQLAAAMIVNQSILGQNAPNMIPSDLMPASHFAQLLGISTYNSLNRSGGEQGMMFTNNTDAVDPYENTVNQASPIRPGISSQSLHNSNNSGPGLSPVNSGAPLTAMLMQRRLSHSGGLLGGESSSSVPAGASLLAGNMGINMTYSNTSSIQDCVFCYERPRNTLLRPCCHLILCSPCAQRLHSRGDSCPICRSDIHEIINVYAA